MKAQSFNRYVADTITSAELKSGGAKEGEHHSRGYLAVPGSADRNG
jgi:hypothetical protein